MVKRCAWAMSSAAMQRYHDEVWCRPEHDTRTLFELLCLETYQVGLSWQTVLNKQSAFEAAFHYYDIAAVAAMQSADIDRLMTNAAIIRNRRKLEATVNNARVLMNWPDTPDFATCLWDFVGGHPIRHKVTTDDEVPATTDLSQHISRELKKRGFKFVGPTTVYSFLQGAGLVNDHVLGCDWAPENQ